MLGVGWMVDSRGAKGEVGRTKTKAVTMIQVKEFFGFCEGVW